MKRLLVALLLGSCGGRSDAGMFEQAVIDANMAFDYCHTGVYSPRDEFPYSEAAALSACRACWLDEHAGRIPLCDEVDDACDDVLWFDRCACVWVTTYESEADCRSCLTEECGVQEIDNASAVCAIERCEQTGHCEFNADCGLR